MAKAALVQSSFTGGEWSPYASGRVDSPHYKAAMELCQNGLPLEVGAWTRRSGTTHVTFTRRGNVSRLYRYRFSWKDNDVILEASYDGSNSWLRFYDGPELVTEAAKTVSAALSNTPAKFTVTGHGYSTDDDVVFYFPQTSNANNGSILLGRVFTVTVIDANTITIADAVSGATFATSACNFDSGVTNKVARVVKFALPYTNASDLTSLRFVTTGSSGQLGIFAGGIGLLLQANYWPFAIGATAVPQAPAFPTFTTNTYASVTNGPYITTTLGAATVSGASGSITFTTGSPLPRETGGFVASDATHNSPIAIYSEPAQWSSMTSYNAGDQVTTGTYGVGNGSTFWTALVANTNQNPPQYSNTSWVATPGLGQWTWGYITAVTSTSVVTVSIQGPAIAYSSNIVSWLEGLWSDHWGYPTCGVFSNGRLWLSNSYLNGRFDASTSGDYFDFGPQETNGQVLDSNAIEYQLTAPGLSPIYWMCEDARGILTGTKNSEWLLASGSGTDLAVTATNIKDTKYSNLGSTPNAEPTRLGAAIAFIQNSTKQVIEYIADTFSGKFGGRVLDLYAQHMSAPGLVRLEQQQSKTPIIWALDSAGQLKGCTYRRISSFITEEPTIYGWHKHVLGTAYPIQDIAAGLCANTTDETLYLCTNDGSHYRVEYIQPIFDEARSLTDGWFLDACPGSWTGGTSTSTRQLAGRDPSLDSGSSGLYFQGLYHLTGQVVTCFINGWNCGPYTVDGAGGITVPYAADPEGLCTKANLIAASGSASTMHNAGCNIDINNSGKTRVVVPVVIGLPYTSQGKLLPPEGPGAPGVHIPIVGETRRIHKFAARLGTTTNAAQFGTDFSHLYNAALTAADDQTDLGASAPFTGVYMGHDIDDDYSFNGQLCWQNSSPYPMTIASVSFFLDAGDR